MSINRQPADSGRLAVLLIDDVIEHLGRMRKQFEGRRDVAEVRTAENKRAGEREWREVVAGKAPVLVILDMCLITDDPNPSLELARVVKESGAVERGTTELIITTSTKHTQFLQQFRDLGFTRFLDKESILNGLVGLEVELGKVVAAMAERAERARVADDFCLPPHLAPVGTSPALRKVYRDVRLDVQNNRGLTPPPIYVVYGATGTGKEWLARAIDFWAGGPGNVFAIGAGELQATDPQIPQAKLFGTARGVNLNPEAKHGVAELAGVGTLLIDDLQTLHPSSRNWMLRFLQFRTFRRVGGVEELTCRARMVVTLNRPIQELLDEGILDVQFRERLLVYGLEYRLPTLTERGPADVVAWAKLFCCEYFRSRQRVGRLDPAARELLMADDPVRWDGNVRELEKFINTACTSVLRTTGPTDECIVTTDVIRTILEYRRPARGQVVPTNVWAVLGFTADQARKYQYYLDWWDDEKFQAECRGRIKGFKKDLKTRNDYLALVEALIKADWDKTKAASEYGIGRQNLYGDCGPLKKYGLEKDSSPLTSS